MNVGKKILTSLLPLGFKGFKILGQLSVKP